MTSRIHKSDLRWDDDLKTGAGRPSRNPGCAAQIRRALVVDEKLDPVALDDRVSGLFSSSVIS